MNFLPQRGGVVTTPPPLWHATPSPLWPILGCFLRFSKNFGTPPVPPWVQGGWDLSWKKNFQKKIFFILFFCFNNPNYKGVILGCFLRIFEKFWCPTPPGFKVAEIWAQKKIFQKKLFFQFRSQPPWAHVRRGRVPKFSEKRKKHLKSPPYNWGYWSKKTKKKKKRGKIFALPPPSQEVGRARYRIWRKKKFFWNFFFQIFLLSKSLCKCTFLCKKKNKKGKKNAEKFLHYPPLTLETSWSHR